MAEQLWVVRAGEQAKHIDEFEHGSHIAIGFAELATDDLLATDEQSLRGRATTPAERTYAGQLATFAFKMDVGDLVIVPRLPKKRDYLVGRITTPYRHVDPPKPSGHHQRGVTWLGTFTRYDLSQDVINTLGSIMTLFRPTKAEAELRAVLTELTPYDQAGASPPPPAAMTRAASAVPTTLPATSPGRTSLTLPPIQFDVRLDEAGRARAVCDHPALVMEQVPRHVDPSSDWAGVPGIYVLTGTDLEHGSARTGHERTLTTTLIVRPWAYVGLSEDFLGRLGSHRQSKPEWRRALLVRSAATPFSSDDIKYLEQKVHGVLAATDEVLLAQAPPRGNLSAQPKNIPLLDACADAVLSVLRLTGTLI